MTDEKEYLPFKYRVVGSGENKYVKIYEFMPSKSATDDIVIPSNIDGIPVKILGHSLFKESGIRSVSIPDTVIEIHPYCFANCVHLKTLKIPDSVKFIFTNVCEGCKRLESVKWSKSADYIPPSAFHLCRKLTKISNIKLVKSINSHAFYGTGFNSFVLPAACINVETAAFANCENLKLVKMGKSVKNISSFAFTLSPKVSIECKNNPAIKDWAVKQDIPIYQTRLDAFLDEVNTPNERGGVINDI